MRVLITWAIMSLAVLQSSEALARVSVDNTQKQLMCLAQNIYYEAGHETVQGKIAVAQVTLNRVHSGDFPSTVCGVVHQKTQVADKTICQFSWACDATALSTKMATAAWRESYRIAWLVMLGSVRVEQLGEDTMYFHNTQSNPHWPLYRIARIGNHIFYTDHKNS